MERKFEMPDFLKGVNAENIQRRMMEHLPKDIDDMPGGFPYDFTMPTALEIDRFTNFHLAFAIKCMFVQFADGEMLDWHGERWHVYRRPARKASGILKIIGDIGITIQEGTVFCTAATNSAPSIMYRTLSDCMIENGEAYIPIEAIEAGRGSNVMAGAICLAQHPIPGVNSISNTSKISDGTDIEDDDVYRERIIEVCQTEIMNVGNPADYVRWAKEVSGVGNAVCISTWNGPLTVKLVITDAQGEPASQSILDDVYDYIFKTKDSLERKAPPDVVLTVVAPEPIDITVKCSVKIEDSYDLNTVKESIRKNLRDYFEASIQEMEIKYARCFSVIDTTEGVCDLKNVLLNNGTENISINQDQYPRTIDIFIDQYL